MDLSRIRVISLDVTGTLLRHRHPIFETYARALAWAKFPRLATPEELRPAFKKAYKKTCLDLPCFGHAAALSSREWWRRCVETCLAEVGMRKNIDYTDAEFNRFFRRVYQHYGSADGYAHMSDAVPFLKWAAGCARATSKLSKRQDEHEQGPVLNRSTTRSSSSPATQLPHQERAYYKNPAFLLGVTTNTPKRTMESVLPVMGLHEFFHFFVCSQDVGAEKPDCGIYEEAENQMKFWLGRTVKPEEILHIGNNVIPDFLAPALNHQWKALYLDRSGDANVTVCQDWLEFEKKENRRNKDSTSSLGGGGAGVRSDARSCSVDQHEIEKLLPACTVKSFEEVKDRLLLVAQPELLEGEVGNEKSGRAFFTSGFQRDFIMVRLLRKKKVMYAVLAC
ncbi:unnamed protein product [Amoebophrya sp. A120]|nr:unnamed protein product [Amoebophrya sp. A120]|eukprot:GSA120T00012183001.1